MCSMLNGVEQKRCGKCETYRNLSEFNYSKQSRDNLCPACKPCLPREREANKSRMTEYNKQYWARTKDKQSERHKEWYQDNKEYVSEYNKRYRNDNIERI